MFNYEFTEKYQQSRINRLNQYINNTHFFPKHNVYLAQLCLLFFIYCIVIHGIKRISPNVTIQLILQIINVLVYAFALIKTPIIRRLVDLQRANSEVKFYSHREYAIRLINENLYYYDRIFDMYTAVMYFKSKSKNKHIQDNIYNKITLNDMKCIELIEGLIDRGEPITDILNGVDYIPEYERYKKILIKILQK